jgi:hypothetical protein
MSSRFISVGLLALAFPINLPTRVAAQIYVCAGDECGAYRHELHFRSCRFAKARTAPLTNGSPTFPETGILATVDLDSYSSSHTTTGISPNSNNLTRKSGDRRRVRLHFSGLSSGSVPSGSGNRSTTIIIATT